MASSAHNLPLYPHTHSSIPTLHASYLAVDGEGRAREPPREANEVVDDGVGRRVAPGAGADVGGGDEVDNGGWVWGFGCVGVLCGCVLSSPPKGRREGKGREKRKVKAYREAMLTMLVEPLVEAMGCSRGTMKGETATDSCSWGVD